MKFLISMLCLNRLESTQAALAAVIEHSSEYELLITDNNSTDGTKEWLAEWAKDKPQVTLIWNNENLGFIPPNNLAFRIAQRRGAKYFIALNNDTRVPARWLRELERPMAFPLVAITGPTGGCNDLSESFHGQPGPYREYVEGSCLCVKIEIIARHWNTLFSPYLDFIYGDDSDLSLRVREKGYYIKHVPIKLEHSRGETVQTQPEVKARCALAQESNHQELRSRWAYYLQYRRFDVPVVIKRKFALGDVVLITPIIKALKEMNPHLHITVETDSPAVFANNPLVAKKPHNKGMKPIVIDLNGSYEDTIKTHIIHAYEDKAREVFPSLPTVELLTELPSSAGAVKWATHLRGSYSPKTALIHVGPTDWVGKNWDPNRWEEICTWLVEQGWHVVAIGATRLPSEIKRCVNLTGQTDIDMLAALMRQCQLFVGIDSGPLHIAQAAGTPTVGLFGVTRARYIMTQGSPHVAVESSSKLPGSGNRHLEVGKTKVDCGPEIMDDITVEKVKYAISKLIQ